MSKPIKKYTLGKIQAAVFQNEYNGQPTYSITFQKSYKKKDGNWENTNFFSQPDMRDLSVLVNMLAQRQVKDIDLNNKPQQTSQQAPQQAPQANPDEPIDIPFS